MNEKLKELGIDPSKNGTWVIQNMQDKVIYASADLPEGRHRLAVQFDENGQELDRDVFKKGTKSKFHQKYQK